MTTMDEAIEGLIESASEHIDRYCGYPDGFLAAKTASAREFAGSGVGHQWIDPCVAITLVEVKSSATSSAYETWASTDWIAFAGSPSRPNFNPTSMSRPRPYVGLMIDRVQGDYSHFTSGKTGALLTGFPPLADDIRETYMVPTVRVTARWGYAELVPATIKEATIMMVLRYLGREMSKMADASGTTDIGRLYYVKRIDPEIEQLLKGSGYMRPRIA